MSGPLLVILLVIMALLAFLLWEGWRSGRPDRAEYNAWCSRVDGELREREGRQP